MFARVITAEPGPGEFDNFIGAVRQQLPAASKQPGARGFYLLTNAETGQIMTISLWEDREQMPAGIHDQDSTAAWPVPPRLETYDVAVHA